MRLTCAGILFIIKNLFMENKEFNDNNNPRRQFLGTIASGVAALGISSIVSPLTANAGNNLSTNHDDPDEWFKQIKGKHRIVFDAPQPNPVDALLWTGQAKNQGTAYLEFSNNTKLRLQPGTLIKYTGT
jgi:hypothetical protein